jgi:uncharacterized protein YuzE
VKLHYYPETDSLYVEFQQRPSVDTREIAPDVRLDVDEQGRPVGLDIDHASTILDLETLERGPAGAAHDIRAPSRGRLEDPLGLCHDFIASQRVQAAARFLKNAGLFTD